MQAEHTLTHTVTAKWAGRPVRSVLIEELQMARQLLIRLKRSGSILINGVPCYLRDPVAQGDILTIILREEHIQDIQPEDIPLDIVFEDEYLLVANKPAGMVVHPTKGYMSGTMGNAIVHHWQVHMQSFVFRPVHRLDRDTSGLVVVAKNPYVQETLTLQHHTQQWEKTYICIVTGEVSEPRGTIEAPIARVGNGSRARVVSAQGKPAITMWERVEMFSQASLLRVRLVTGRTHQIRVHMAHIGHPLWGDDVYGSPSALIERQALHAGEVSFVHPINKQTIHLTCPMPSDMAQLRLRLLPTTLASEPVLYSC